MRIGCYYVGHITEADYKILVSYVHGSGLPFNAWMAI